MANDESGQEYYVGVDMGGTKIMAGLFNSQLECISYYKQTTKAHKGVDVVVERVLDCIQQTAEAGQIPMSSVRGIGLGAPGAVDPETGLVIFAPNLQWKKVPLVQMLKKKLGVPVYLENDCQICTLGVQEVELKGTPQHLVGIFLGTGIGSGLILNKKLFTGFNRTAGEIGHMVLDVNGPSCRCGNKGCFEALASRTAIMNRITSAVKKGQKTVLTDMLGSDLKDLKSGKLRKAIARGDKFVERVVVDAARYTGIAVANVINLLNPEYVILGGGLVEQMEDLMMGVISETARKYAMSGTLDGISIQATKLADDAGIVGGAVLAKQQAALHPSG